MGWTKLLVVVTVILSLAAPPAAPAERGEARRYKVDAVEARWAVPKQREGRYRMWSVDAARYEDLESGDVQIFAEVDRFECEGDEDGLSCGSDLGPWRSTRGTPEVFEFADDLSRASLRLGDNEVEWVVEDATEKPWDLVPYTFSRREGCPEGTGSGEGVYRGMRARGAVFGRKIEYEDERSFVGIARYVLETECEPGGWWWPGGSALALPQWLRRAEASSFLSMFERPSMPTSFALS